MSDTPIGAVLTGRTAIGFKEAISRSTTWLMAIVFPAADTY
ncbi:hypothetical protein ACWD8I_28315 [Micromonospora arida]